MDTDAKVVIDKSRVWGLPYYINVLRYALESDPKIICPVRPLAEVVASFIVKCRNNEDNFIDRNMRQEDFLPLWHKPIDDARVDWLLSPNSMLGTAMLSVHNALHEDTKHMFHVVEYDELVDNPHRVISGIYDFLGVEAHDHEYSRIANTEPYRDAEVFGIPDFHAVHYKIRRSTIEPEAVLSDYALTRCQLEDFWTVQVQQQTLGKG
jgi:hypothetical protein